MPTKSKPSLGGGNVEFELANSEGELETVTLKPSLRAAQYVSRLNGGYMGAIEACSKADFDAITGIVKTGLNLTDNGAKGLDERIYQTGVMKVAVPAIEFVTILANGGKRPDESDPDEGDENPK